MNPEKLGNILADRIRNFRNSKGWTQERLAEEVNIHPTYISRIESGKKLPTLIIVDKIADALEVHAYELLMDEKKAVSYDYKKRKLIDIVNESTPSNIDIYSALLHALHKTQKERYKEKKR